MNVATSFTSSALADRSPNDVKLVATFTETDRKRKEGYLLILLVWARHFHASSMLSGLVVASSGVGWIMGSLLVGPLARRFSFVQLLGWASWIWTLSWLLFAIPTNIWLLGGAAIGAFLVVPLHTSTQYTYRLTHIPAHLQGRVNALMRLLIFGAQSLGLLITGQLLQSCGPRLTVLLLFLPQGLLALCTAFYLRHYQRIRTGND